MPSPAPPVGTTRTYNGKTYRFNGGENTQANWSVVGGDAAPAPAATGWPAGFTVLPNGDAIGPRGPRGGPGQVFHPKPGTPGSAAPTMNVSQGQSTSFGMNMADAERSYLRARDNGYDPTSGQNATASIFESIPSWALGLNGMGAVIRDDVSDKGHQAERQWADAQLRSVSGAAAPEQEVRRLVSTYFPAAGMDLGSVEPQFRNARQTALTAVAARAGPGSALIKPPPVRRPITDRSREAYQGMVDTPAERAAPVGSREHPMIARDRETLVRLSRNPAMAGKWAIGPSGALVQISPRAATPRPGTPSRPSATKPISEMSDAELRALAGGH